jgi:pyruvate,orthophosphate dikinase
MRVYTFGRGVAEGTGDMLPELGSKGSGLADMCQIGVPVPPGFTISTDACRAFFEADQTFPDVLASEIERGVQHIEAITGKTFGDQADPLLVSVRSGAAISMPGMMDTVLNVGLSPSTVESMASEPGRRLFVLDSYRRFIEMFGEIAAGLDPMRLANVREDVLTLARQRSVQALDDQWLQGLIDAYLKALNDDGVFLPKEPRLQLRLAIIGVFDSWNTPRAIRFRKANGIPDKLGTAVTVQAMVFGNRGPRSATGVAFTRNPNTGEPGLFGEYLPQAQGEDVVSGCFTPRLLGRGENSLEAEIPDAYQQLVEIAAVLETHYRDVQDLEFTIERGKLWMLQTRCAKRSARAAVQVAVDMVHEGLITKEQALLRVAPDDLSRLLHASVDAQAHKRVIAKGLPASPGAVSGIAIFSPSEAIARSNAGEKVILVRLETSTDDMEAIRLSAGVLTARGGMTSHAALVARGLGRVCITGCSDIIVEERKGRFRVRNGSMTVKAGDPLTIDGSTGEVILGRVATSPADPPEAFARLMSWADELRSIGIRSNADNATAFAKAFVNGAQGIGLCCTEHMFLDDSHLGLVREMVLAYDARTRRRVVEHILPVQRQDFRSILEVAPDKPIAIRLLDLPLHDLMPVETADLASVAERLDTTVDQLAHRARLLRPSNPILGHRGCRLGITFPELYEVQIRALFEAAVELGSEQTLEIVIPLVTTAEEVKRLRRRIEQMVKQVCEERKAKAPSFEVGAMIESPKACLDAGKIAEHCDFILIGTTDLTISTFAIHRDDAGRYLPFYLEQGVLPADPFVELDDTSVGELIRLAVQRAREAKPGIRIGLGGGHANQPSIVGWCIRNGIDYITCDPHRLPMNRLAAAQAAIEDTVSV